jgi:protein-tyrosine phosphatase
VATQLFKVLIVCEGNLCRSPIAEQLLKKRTSSSSVSVFSAGLRAREGIAMPDEMSRLSRHYGGDPDAHRSQQLNEAHLIEADLVLTATRAQRASVVRMLPRMSRRTFTIGEFVRLIGAVPPGDRETLTNAGDLVEAARSLRGLVAPPDDPEEDDLEDPYRQTPDVYESVAARINADMTRIANELSNSFNHS